MRFIILIVIIISLSLFLSYKGILNVTVDSHKLKDEVQNYTDKIQGVIKDKFLLNQRAKDSSIEKKDFSKLNYDWLRLCDELSSLSQKSLELRQKLIEHYDYSTKARK